MVRNKTIGSFIDELKSDAPTPGGGGVASLSAAQGVALIMMVANLTVNNEKYIEWHELCKKTLARCQDLLDILVDGVDDDAVQFKKVISAYGLPCGTDEEKEQRSLAISEASISAAEAPLRVMEASAEALELDVAIIGKSNPNVESDLYVAARCLHSGLLSAKYNVDANIGGIKTINPELAAEYAEKSEALVSKADTIINQLF